MSNIFNDIADGLVSFDEEIFSEATLPSNLPENKVISRQVILPQGNPVGKGILCFLYTHSQAESFDLLKNRSNFLDKTNKYKYYYYNLYYQGKIYNKKYRFYDLEERSKYYDNVLNDKELSLNPRKKLSTNEKENRNMYYELFRYLEIFENICSKLQPLIYIKCYWEYFKQIYSISIPGYTEKFVLINIKNFSLTKSIKENLMNPLFILYYTILRKPEYVKELDIDFLFFNDKRVMKINPSHSDDNTDRLLKVEMKKMMNGITSDVVIDDATDETEITKDEIVSNTVNKVIGSIRMADDGSIITTTSDLHKANKIDAIEKNIENKIKEKTSTLTDEAISGSNLSQKIQDNVTNDINKSIRKEIETDSNMIKALYALNKSESPKSSISTARDELLRSQQKDITVGNMKISDIEKIDTSKIPITVTDVSRSLKTTNENMKQIRFGNFDKDYNEKIMKKDITNAILSLNNKSIPMFVRDIKIEDTSDELNYKDTYTILLEDGNRKRHTIKVDIPKFIENKFLYIGGNKKLIKHQNFFYPVVKIAPDMVQIVTNYSKMTIQRVETKSVSYIERLKKLISSKAEAAKFFTVGSAYVNNKKFLTTLEYDDLSKTYSSFNKDEKTVIFFDREQANLYMKENNIPEKQNKIFIGKENGNPIYIDINTQEDETNATITEIIIRNLPEDLSNEFNTIKAPKRLMYAKVKIMKQFINVGMLIGMWEGLSEVLKKLKCEYRITDNAKELKPNEEFIKFKDCVLIYKANIPNSLVLNGIRMFNTSNYGIADFDEKTPYLDYITGVYGKVIIENALMNFYEFAIDPITKEVLEMQHYPTDIVSLFIYAINLLSDSQFENDISQNLSRVRCGEIIPAILYERISKNYVSFRNYGGRKKFSIPQDCVIKEILDQKTVEDYSTLNPTLEMEMTHAISSKGFRGVNLDNSYTMEKRGYDSSMTGIISPSTSPDGNVGVSKTLSLEPKITNLRGFTEDYVGEGKIDELKDVNLFSPGELSIPLGATIDDATRLGHAIKQSKHVIPVKDASPVLISNGLEEVARFHLSSSFVINAEEDGEIVDYDEETHIMIAKYKSGKCQAIDLNPNIVKNSGGGFFLSNILVTDLQVGSKFKKNDVLAYHKDFFKNDEFNNCRMTMGTLTKVAIMSTYNTYEDSTIITQKLSERCATEMVFLKSAVIGKNSNVFYIVKKGQEITVGDPLVQFDTSYEDETINTLLANLSQAEKENVLEGARNEIKSKYSGVIEDIKIYSTIDLEEMSPSLRKIVSAYYREIDKKKEILNKYDPESKSSVVKCGIMVTDTTKKIQPNRFGVIKGEHVEDSVLIEFYIKHSEPLEIGSKIANFTALKNTIGEIVPEGYEPYSSYRPDEEVSTFIASNSILNRMTPSILLTALGNKCIIELKRHLKELNYDRPKMEKMIYSFFDAMDKSKTNTKKYKALFEPMSDNQFKSYFKKLFSNEYAYLILDIVDYEHTVNLTDIEDAAKVIDVPLYEYVTLPHLTMDKENAIVTKIPVPVGYINEKRTQQTVMKKNGVSTDISERSAITNQVTGHDKNGRESDMENIMLTALGLKNTLKELNGPRSDDSVMKTQMLHDIALNGYTKLEDMTDDLDNKSTLNTVDCYLRGMSIESDLVVTGLMLPATLKKEL